MINRLHKEVWTRFVRMPYGHILDYVGDSGEIYYPTPEQCERAIPNGLGWWTPIENGAFFTGLYTYSLLNLYSIAPTEQLKNEINILINGLFRLQDVARNEGFIARGVAEDGVSHYPISSDDQIMPWVLAVWKYYHSSLCKNREDTANRLVRVIGAIKSDDFHIPTDWDGVRNGISLVDHPGWRGVAMLLFITRVLADVTGSEEDLALYRQFASGKPVGSIFTRLEMISHGFSHEMVNSYGKKPWICTSTHLAMREMIGLDTENECYYRQAIYNNGITTLPMIDGMKSFTLDGYKFSADWTPILSLWSEQGESVTLQREMARRQSVLWNAEIVPGRHQEHSVLGNPLYAAWIAVTSGDERIRNLAFSKFEENCNNIPWESLHFPMAYPAESVFIFYRLCSQRS